MAITKVTNSLVATNAIQGTLIADNAITSVHIAQNQVTSVQIPDSSITSTQLAANSVDTAEIISGSIDAIHLASDSVTTAKILDANVTTAKIANNAITSALIPDGSITDTQLGSGAFTMGNITTTGSIRGPASFTIDPAAVGDNTGTVVIAGSLQVDGTTTTINSTTLSVADKKIELASGAADAAAANDSGITVTGANATLRYLSSGDKWSTNKDLEVNSKVNTNTINNIGNTANIIYRSSTNTIVGNNATALVVQDGGNIGIGKANPGATLDMEKSSGATLFMGDTNGRNLRFRTANSGSQNTNISSYAGLYLGGSDNASHVLIAGDGDVTVNSGIFTTIHDITTVNKFKTTNNNTRSIISMESKDSSGNAVDLRMHALGDGPRGEVYTYTNHPLAFATNNAAPQMTLLTNGNFGIDEDTPATRLHVVGGRASGTMYNTAVFAGGQNSTSGSGARLYISGCENDPLARGTIIEGKMNDNGNSHELNFYTSGNSQAPAKRLTIDNNGRVRIGATLGLNHLLNIQTASTSGLAQIEFRNTQAGTQIGMPANTNAIAFFTADGERMRIASDGAVTLKPNGITTGLRLQGRSSDNNFYIQFKSNDGNTTYSSIGTDSANTALFYQSNTHKFQNTASNNTYMTIDSNGKVGIGETSPETSLHIKNAGNSFLTLERSGTSGGTGKFGINMEGGSSQQTTMGYDDGGKLVIGRSSDPATMAGFSNDFVLDSSGNVGIGTTGPNAPLEINGGTAMTGGWGRSLLLRHNFPVMVFQSEYSTDAYGAIGYDNSTGMHFMVNSPSIDPFSSSQQPALFIRDDKNIGIGTTSPQNILHIHQNAVDSRMQFTNNSSGTAYADGLWVGLDNNQAYLLHRENTAMSFWTNATKRMIIHADGRILMNTPDPHNGGAEVLHITTTGASGGYGINIKTASSGGGTMMRFNTTGSIVGQITTSGSATTYHTSSDARLKDITGKARGLEVINKLNPVSYTWKLDGSADEGFIAQEVEKLIPNVVHQNADDDMYSMDYGRITPLLVKAIQEQQTLIQTLQREVQELKENG